MGRPEERAEQFSKAVREAMQELQRSQLLPLMKVAFMCSARCVDTASDDEIQTCLVRCEEQPEAAKQVIEGNMQQFQARMQRCVQRSQDQAQESLPSQPSEKDIAKAQDKLANSMADCADEYRKKIPKLKQDIAAQIKAHLQQQG